MYSTYLDFSVARGTTGMSSFLRKRASVLVHIPSVSANSWRVIGLYCAAFDILIVGGLIDVRVLTMLRYEYFVQF